MLVEAIFELENTIFANPSIEKDTIVFEIAKKHNVKECDLSPYFNLFVNYRKVCGQKARTIQKKVIWTLDERLIIYFFVNQITCTKTKKFQYLSHILRFTERTKESISFDYYNNIAPPLKRNELHYKMKELLGADKLNSNLEDEITVNTNSFDIDDLEDDLEDELDNDLEDELDNDLDDELEENVNIYINEDLNVSNGMNESIEKEKIVNSVLISDYEEDKSTKYSYNINDTQNDFLSDVTNFIENSKTLSNFNLESFFFGLNTLSSIAATKVLDSNKLKELELKTEEQDELIYDLKSEIESLNIRLESIRSEISKFNALDGIDKVGRIKEFSLNLLKLTNI